jgi:hypothetical protein
LTQINGRLVSADKDKPLFNCGLPEHTTAAANYTNTFATPNLTGNDVNPDLFMQILRYDNPDATIGSTTPACVGYGFRLTTNLKSKNSVPVSNFVAVRIILLDSVECC